MMTSRDNFETWWQREFHNGNEPRGGWGVYRHSEGYSDEELSGQWKAWQAALASQQPADDGANGVISDEQSVMLKDAAREIISGDGWIEWEGGGCPVADNERVQVKFADGCTGFIDRPQEVRWHTLGSVGDIIAYRVVKP